MKRWILTIFLLVMAAPALSQPEDFCADIDITGIPQEECEALLAIIEANPNFTDWIDEDRIPINNSPCTWAGVTCENGGVVRLNLYNNDLTTLPPEIGQLNNLTALNLLSNQLTELPPEIGQLSSLGGLLLGNNQLTELPPEIGQLSNLTGLSLENNQLTELPPEIGQLNALYSLVLGGNQLTQLPSEIGQLTNLGELSLQSNQLTTLPSEITQLDNLWGLYLGINQITLLPPEIGQFASLRVLGLSDNQLTELPPEIGQIKSLCSLDVQNNQLHRIPVEVVLLLSQRTQECQVNRNPIGNPYTLLIYGNPLVSPPPEVVEQGHEAILAFLQDEARSDDFCTDMDMAGIPQEECEALLAIIEANPDFTYWIDDDRTPINNSPCTWEGITCANGRVVRLNLYNNNLTTLPPEIGQLSSLTSLSLENNQLTELPPEIGQLNALYILNLGENHLTQLPSEIGQLINLGELSLRVNQLTTFPSEIVQLDNLWGLYLSSNQITSLPPEIGQFASLRVLALSDNQLTELRPEIRQIKSLCSLNVNYNQLRRIPVELVLLLTQRTQECQVNRNPIGNPYTLLISGNPLVSPPPEVVEQGHEAILAYLQNETRSDTQLSIAYIAIGIGLLGLLMLLGFRYRRYKQKRISELEGGGTPG